MSKEPQEADNKTRVTMLVDIKHSYQVWNNLSTLCMNEECSDLIIVVEGQRLHAHKVILGSRSEYFKAMLFGSMRESKQSEIEIFNVPLDAFKTLLQYIYTGEISLTMEKDLILDILGLANQYGILDLEVAIIDILKQSLSLENVCSILDRGCLYGLEDLVQYCYTFADKNALELLKHDTFIQLSKLSLVGLLERDSFYVREVEIFQALLRWKQENDIDDEVLECIRLPLISTSELLSVVRPTGIITLDTLLDAIDQRTHDRMSNVSYRKKLCKFFFHISSVVAQNFVLEYEYLLFFIAHPMQRSFYDHFQMLDSKFPGSKSHDWLHYHLKELLFKKESVKTLS